MAVEQMHPVIYILDGGDCVWHLDRWKADLS